MCVRSVRAGLNDVVGIKATNVCLENGTAKVLRDQNVKPDQLTKAVKEAGFETKLSPKLGADKRE